MDYAEALSAVQRGYTLDFQNGIGLFRVPMLEAYPNLSHGFTARVGGVSAGPYSSLNLGWSRNEPRENIERNYRLLCGAAGLKYEDLILVSYDHGVQIEAVNRLSRGRGFSRSPLPLCDGLITNDPSAALITLHADCSAIYLYDPVNHAIGLAHAGWKGVLGRIGSGLVIRMAQEYGSEPSELIAAVGPLICGRCFEVDEELGNSFIKAFRYQNCCRPGTRPGKLYLNLQDAACIDLLDAGLLPERIAVMDACTFEMESMLFSHRRDNGKTGAMAAYIQLEKRV